MENSIDCLNLYCTIEGLEPSDKAQGIFPQYANGELALKERAVL
jgi:hypothetical protein